VDVRSRGRWSEDFCKAQRKKSAGAKGDDRVAPFKVIVVRGGGERWWGSRLGAMPHGGGDREGPWLDRWATVVSSDPLPAGSGWLAVCLSVG
jgi:hypothetical protein